MLLKTISVLLLENMGPPYHIAIENDVYFVLFTDTILTYLSCGYTQTKIVEMLMTTFTKEVV